ncbi:MAG: hypothetical protein ACXIUB_07090 [Wenzhouxiangella sp.]
MISGRLKSLPPVDPPPELWTAIEATLEGRQHRRRWLLGSGLVALLLVGLTLGLQWLPQHPSGESAEMAQLTELQALSAQLEAQLRDRLNTPLRLTDIETLILLDDELQWLDIQLASAPDAIELWQQRVDLLVERKRVYEQAHWQVQLAEALR